MTPDPAAKKLPPRRELAANLLVALLSTALFLYFGELLLRVLHLPKEEVLAVSQDPQFHVEHFAGPRPEWMEEDPQLLWRWKRSRTIIEERKEIGMHWWYRTNSRGFRGADFPASPGRPLVLCAGNSVTAGYGVTDADSYPSVLEATLRKRAGWEKCQVLNVGVYGYSTEQGRILLSRLLGELRPDVLIIEYGINDDALSVYRDDQLIGDGSLVRLVQTRLARYHLYRALRAPITRFKLRRRVLSGSGRDARVPPDRYAENLRAIARLAREVSAKTIFVAPPGKWEWGVKGHTLSGHPERVLNAYSLGVYRSVMGAVASENRIPYLFIPSLTGYSRESRDRFADWCHPDADGLCLIAEGLAPLVAEAQDQR